MASSQKDIKTLTDLTSQTLHLLGQFSSILSSSAPAPATSLPAQSPDPLSVLADASTLLHAQTTKLSLLLLNKPFTPTAVTTVIRAISTTCLPAMMSAVEICRPEKYSDVMSHEIKSRVGRVFREMETMMREVMAVSSAANSMKGGKETDGPAFGAIESGGRDSLASTGVVWEACNAIINLQRMGLGGLIVEKAEQYRDTIKDAIEELKEWSEEVEDDEAGSEDESAGSDEDEDRNTGDVENIFAAANKLPKDRGELHAQLEGALKKLKMIGMLYQALVKRRLKTFPQTSSVSDSQMQQLNQLMMILRSLPEIVDELVGGFYELDDKVAKAVLSKCCEDARAAAATVRLSWDGTTDEFSAWKGKWEDAMAK
ncbi:hypothetical protein B0A49_10148 [Cryomyces minteri]|uniref:Cyclin-D1-binding protein 1-like N-terminal domain-containing protein n=1 Tax=Cryomyces minteri TaxID=331657 RepID=A0A4U0WQH8_9PEZI|nr:hypothetical protein B0A49_10148 [Cryomyces minteri]